MQVKDSTAIVFGGASGLGEATVRNLASGGAQVVIADLNQEKGGALADELKAEFALCDVTDEAQVSAAVDKAKAIGSGLRISICCAGVGWAERTVGKNGPHQLLPFETVLKVNLIGTFNALRFGAAAINELEPLQDGERGVCVNTASIAAFDGQVGQLAYSASKGGIVGMTLPAARDLASRGIRVNTIAPGTFDTPLLAALPGDQREALGKQIPFPNRLGKPTEFGALAVQIVENQMLNGETIRLDGALRMPPR